MMNHDFQRNPEAKAAAISHGRACVACNIWIPAGNTCDCQEPDAMNCPICKRNIPRKHFIAFTSVHLGTSTENLELRLHCPKPGCAGYLYNFTYLADFVPHKLDDHGNTEEKTDPQD